MNNQSPSHDSAVDCTLLLTYLTEWGLPLCCLIFYTSGPRWLFLSLGITSIVSLLSFFIYYGRRGGAISYYLPFISVIVAVIVLLNSWNLLLVAPVTFLVNSTVTLLVTFVQTLLSSPRHIVPFAMAVLGIFGMYHGYVIVMICFCVYCAVFMIGRVYITRNYIPMIIYAIIGFLGYCFMRMVDYSAFVQPSVMTEISAGFFISLAAVLFNALVRIKVVQQMNKR